MASVAKRRWKKPDGSIGEAWAVRYTDEGGSRRSKTFPLKKDADAFRRKVEREIEEGTHVAAAVSKTMTAVCDEFLRHNDTRVRDGRITQGRLDNIEKALRTHIKPALGDRLVRDLVPDDVDRLYREMVSGKGLNPRYARAVLREAVLVEKFANKRGYMKTHPIANGMHDLRGLPKAAIRTLTIQEAAALLRLALTHHDKSNRRVEDRTACMVHLAACCGLRVGEILALRPDAIDLDRKEVHVRHSMTMRGTIKGPKTAAGRRSVPLPDHLVGMLRAWIEQQMVANELGILFTDARGARCRHTSVYANWVRLLTDAGLYEQGDVIHFHALRHFAGSWWLANGMSIPRVSVLLGHADPAVTMRIYIHELNADDDRAEAVQAPATRLMAIASDAQETHGLIAA